MRREIYILTAIITILILATNASAYNVGTTILLPNGTTLNNCVNVDEEATAFEVLNELDVNYGWKDFGFGFFLESVEGFGSTNNKYWSFWHQDNTRTSFEASMVGVSDYKINNEETVLGLSLTAYDNNYNPITEPPFTKHEDLCENPIDIDDVDVYVDGDKNSLDNGDDVEAKPGSEIVMLIKIDNLNEEIELENVEATLLIKKLDDGDDVDYDSDRIDIEEDESGELEIEFQIPWDVDEDTYDMELIVEGDIDLPYKKTNNYELEIDKNSHEVQLKLSKQETAVCGSSILFPVTANNIGSDDEEINLKVYSTELGIGEIQTFELYEGDSTRKTFSLRVPSDAIGEYLLLTEAIYNDEREIVETSLSVECEEQEQQENIPVQQLNTQQNQGQENTPTTEFVSSDSNQANNNQSLPWNMIALVFGNILLIGILIIIILK